MIPRWNAFCYCISLATPKLPYPMHLYLFSSFSSFSLSRNKHFSLFSPLFFSFSNALTPDRFFIRCAASEPSPPASLSPNASSFSSPIFDPPSSLTPLSSEPTSSSPFPLSKCEPDPDSPSPSTKRTKKRLSHRHTYRCLTNHIPTSPYISVSPYATPYQLVKTAPTLSDFTDHIGVPHRDLTTHLVGLWIRKDLDGVRRFLSTCFFDPTFLTSIVQKFTPFEWGMFLKACYACNRFSEIQRFFTLQDLPMTPVTLNFVMASYFYSSDTSAETVMAVFHEYPALVNETSLVILAACLLPSFKHFRYKRFIDRCLTEGMFENQLDLRFLKEISQPNWLIEIHLCLNIVRECIQLDKPFPVSIDTTEYLSKIKLKKKRWYASLKERMSGSEN